MEKKSILNSYKIFLKTCNFDIQILIQSNKEDLSKNIFKIEKNTSKKEKNYLKNISENYIKYIKKINKEKKSSTKNYYLIICNKKEEKNKYENYEEIIKNELSEKYFKIKECLARCGNQVIEINNEKEIINIIFSFFNTKKYFNNK